MLGAGAAGGVKGDDDGPRKEEQGVPIRKRGPALPAAPAKSLPVATKNFYKCMRSVAQEAANITAQTTMDSREGSSACAVGVLVMAVAHGLTEHKNGRMSKEDERVAANRKPQAFILSTGHIPPASMQKIFSCALQGGSREGSPPAEITNWQGLQQAEQWFAMRKSEGLRGTKEEREEKKTAEKSGEGGVSRSVAGEGSSAQQSAAPPPPLQKHPIMMGLITPEQDMRTKTAQADIGKWLRDECGAGLDDEDVVRVLNCLTNPDRGIPDKATLFAMSEEELYTILAPIREHGLKNFILQMCKRMKQPPPPDAHGSAAKMRKTNYNEAGGGGGE